MGRFVIAVQDRANHKLIDSCFRRACPWLEQGNDIISHDFLMHPYKKRVVLQR